MQTPTGNGHSNGAIGGERPKVKSVSEMLGGASGKRSGGGGVVGERLFVCYVSLRYIPLVHSGAFESCILVSD